ncbi:hypothetical protein ACET3Z_001222 [Daucus carota]
MMGDSISRKIWRVVAAIALWNTWLAQNDALFSQTWQSHENIEELIRARVTALGKVFKSICFGNDPMWRINPLGAIKVYYSKLSCDYLNTRFNSFDLVGGVDEAWGKSNVDEAAGAIRGYVRNSKDVAWRAPKIGTVKINKQYVSLENHPPNEHNNGVGITHAYNKGFDRMEVDTMNIKVFDIIDFQYVILVPRAFSHVVTQLNTRHSKYYEAGKTECHIVVIPALMNGPADYLARYGMRSIESFEETTSNFADLQTYLESDMRRAVPDFLLATGSAFGQEEVIDADPPDIPELIC